MKKGKKEKPGKGKAENSTAEKLTRKAYETELARLHGELVQLQQWVLQHWLQQLLVL